MVAKIQKSVMNIYSFLHKSCFPLASYSEIINREHRFVETHEWECDDDKIGFKDSVDKLAGKI